MKRVCLVGGAVIVGLVGSLLAIGAIGFFLWRRGSALAAVDHPHIERGICHGK